MEHPGRHALKLLFFLIFIVCVTWVQFDRVVFSLVTAGLFLWLVVPIERQKVVFCKPFFGREGTFNAVKDMPWILLEGVICVSYAIIYPCYVQSSILFAAVLPVCMALVVLWMSRQRVGYDMMQRRTWYRVSLLVGLGYSGLNVMLPAGVENVLHDVVFRRGVCSLVTLFDRFVAGMIDVLPVPFNLVLSILNLNLVFGFIVTLYALLYTRVYRWLFNRNMSCLNHDAQE
jgi:hypothetical protein